LKSKATPLVKQPVSKASTTLLPPPSTNLKKQYASRAPHPPAKKISTAMHQPERTSDLKSQGTLLVKQPVSLARTTLLPPPATNLKKQHASRAPHPPAKTQAGETLYLKSQGTPLVKQSGSKVSAIPRPLPEIKLKKQHGPTVPHPPAKKISTAKPQAGGTSDVSVLSLDLRLQ
jgi:hypothetical protein